MNSLQDYTIILCPDEDGSFFAYIPSLPGCQAWGNTPDQARSELVYVFHLMQDDNAQEKARSLVYSKDS